MQNRKHRLTRVKHIRILTRALHAQISIFKYNSTDIFFCHFTTSTKSLRQQGQLTGHVVSYDPPNNRSAIFFVRGSPVARAQKEGG